MAPTRIGQGVLEAVRRIRIVRMELGALPEAMPCPR